MVLPCELLMVIPVFTPTAAVPAALVPTKFPATRFPPAPPIRTAEPEVGRLFSTSPRRVEPPALISRRFWNIRFWPLTWIKSVASSPRARVFGLAPGCV